MESGKRDQMKLKSQLRGEERIELENKLADYDGPDKIVSSHEIAKRLEDVEDSFFKIKTGVPSMDRILDDIEAGELTIVTGPSGEGKTTLLMTITSNMCEQNVNSAWFTLEVTPRQFIKKLTARGGDLPLFYMPAQNIDNYFDWLEERILEAIIKHDVKAVFIDHLHMIFNLAQLRSNSSLQIGHLADSIKDIAVKNNIAIFLIVHNKDNTQNPLEEIRKEDLRDSGLIARAADSIIGVWRVNNGDTDARRRPKHLHEDDNWAKVKILKNRGEGVFGHWFMEHNNHYLTEINTNIPHGFGGR